MNVWLPPRAAGSPLQRMGERNWILDQSARSHEWSGAGALSLKWFPRGEARYLTEAGEFLVRDEALLILNADEPYSVSVDGVDRAESFCIFFERGYVEDLWRAATTPLDQLLDRSISPAPHALEWHSRTYENNGALLPLLAHLRETVQAQADVETLFMRLDAIAMAMVGLREDVVSEIARVPAARAATRVELHRRLHRARDFIRAHAYDDLPLAEIAGVAELSPNHLLRTFQSLFGATPHQYATNVRLRRAAELLRTTARPVVDICTEVGFSSVPSFTTLFKRHFGITPAAYRSAR
ncbi:MAG TPA: AraC family transcriptional regulator [Thermoanaerobaculia bacterium]